LTAPLSTPAKHEERISRGAAFALAAQLVGAALTAVLTIFLGRRLTAGEYGSYVFALSVLAIAALFADFGMTSSTGRFMAAKRGDVQAIADTWATALRLKVPISLGASIALFAVAGPICEAFATPAATWPLRIVAVALFSQTLFALAVGVFIALGMIRYNLLLATVESVVEVGVSVTFVLAGAGAVGATLGYAAGYTAGLVTAAVIARRVLRRKRAQRVQQRQVSSRQLLSYAGPLLFVEAAFRLFASIDVLLIAALVGGTARIAAFGLAMRLAGFLDYPAGAVASAVSPRLAQSHRAGDSRNDLSNSLRYLVILQMMITVATTVWAQPIVHLIFGSKYAEAPGVLRALAPFIFLSGIAQVATLSVNYLGYARRRVPLAVAMLAVNVVVDVLLLPKIGVVAGAIGTSAAYAIWVPGHLRILQKNAGLAMRGLLLTTARVCLCGGALAGVLISLGTQNVPVGVMLVGAIAGPLTYFAALVITRELTFADLHVMRRAISRHAG